MGQKTRCLALLHGFLGRPEVWDEFLSFLHPASCEILRPCLPGHDPEAGSALDTCFADARTDRGDDFTDTGIARDRGFADAVDRLARQLAPSAPLWLAGYSMGGRLALGLALTHPRLVERLTLIGVNPGLAETAIRTERRELEARWIRLLEDEGLDAFLRYWKDLPLFASQRKLAPARQEAQESARRRHDPHALARAIKALGLAAMPDYTSRLRELKFPVDLIVGEHDGKFRGLAEDMFDDLRSGRLLVIPDVGHNVVLEDPAALADCFREDQQRAVSRRKTVDCAEETDSELL